jgi:hypothetical protein
MKRKPAKREQVRSPHPAASNKEGLDQLMIGTVIDGRRYMGNGSWQHLNHLESFTNKRRFK